LRWVVAELVCRGATVPAWSGRPGWGPPEHLGGWAERLRLPCRGLMRQWSPLRGRCRGVMRQWLPLREWCRGLMRQWSPLRGRCRGVMRQWLPLREGCRGVMRQ